jgi:hypothetical protein
MTVTTEKKIIYKNVNCNTCDNPFDRYSMSKRCLECAKAAKKARKKKQNDKFQAKIKKADRKCMICFELFTRSRSRLCKDCVTMKKEIRIINSLMKANI